MSMTESEAIAIIEDVTWNGCGRHYGKIPIAREMAISALEEVQKIKKLGDCYIIPKNGTWEANGIDIHKALEEIQQYRAIGTVSEFRELKEKATAKKPKTKKYVCPNCKRTLNVTRYDTYCEICCGRLYVDWSEGKE